MALLTMATAVTILTLALLTMATAVTILTYSGRGGRLARLDRGRLLHRVAASVTYGCSLHRIWLQVSFCLAAALLLRFAQTARGIYSWQAAWAAEEAEEALV